MLQARSRSFDIDRYLKRQPSNLIQSIKIIRLKDKKVLIEHDANREMVPASVMKLVTSGAALHFFGSHHQFETKLFHTKTRSQGKITGNLVVVGGGDPMLTSEKLWQMAADLRHLGIREVKGNLIVDNSFFEGPARDRARQEGKRAASFAYDAPISALGINFNTYAIAIAPGASVGARAIVRADPYALPSLKISNRVTTTKAGRKGKLRATRISLKNGGASLQVSGTIAKDQGLKKLYRSVNDPVLASGEIVQAFLKAQGVTVQGKVVKGKAPQNAKPLLSFKGAPLAKVVKSLNYYSNNYIADVLMRALGKKTTATSKQVAQLSINVRGTNMLEHFLRDIVKTSAPFKVADGSGLSTTNRMSAAALTALLVFMSEKFDIFPEFITSLPSSGLTGSLKDRFRTKETAPLVGFVRAKTGTLSRPVSVSTIAGYIEHPTHGTLAFAILQNGRRKTAQPNILEMRRKQDISLQKVLQYL